MKYKIFFSKIILTLKVIKNLPTFILDYFGLMSGKEIVYETWNNLEFFTRIGTPDKAEIVIVCGGSEYPGKYFVKEKNLVVLDVGAHIGTFTAYLNRILEKYNPLVYAIEPSEDNFRMLSNNIKLNNFKNTNCCNLAIGSFDGYGNINLEKEYDALTITEDKTLSNLSHVNDSDGRCSVLTLETFCSNEKITKIDILKMDCEGAEHRIFKTSLKFIQENVKTLFIEVHDVPGEISVAEFKHFLIENNFSVEAEILNRTYFAKNLNFK